MEENCILNMFFRLCKAIIESYGHMSGDAERTFSDTLAPTGTLNDRPLAEHKLMCVADNKNLNSALN